MQPFADCCCVCSSDQSPKRRRLGIRDLPMPPGMEEPEEEEEQPDPDVQKYRDMSRDFLGADTPESRSSLMRDEAGLGVEGSPMKENVHPRVKKQVIFIPRCSIWSQGWLERQICLHISF